MKQLYKTSLAIYVTFLLWLVLFKTSTDLLGVLTGYQSRSLSLVPFAGYSPGNAREMLDNLIVFIPLGLLLGVNYKQALLRRKLAFVFIFSLSAEIAQYAFAIGITDITDIILNTLGGLTGLAAYKLVSKYVNTNKLDMFIVVVMAALLTAFMLLRFFVFKVRY